MNSTPETPKALAIDDLRRCSVAVFLATDEMLAADISRHLRWAADTIATQAKALAEARNDALEEAAKYHDTKANYLRNMAQWRRGIMESLEQHEESAATLRALKTPTPTSGPATLGDR